MDKIVKGDKVRFLNAVGGGIVTRIDEKAGIVYVEDEDGFEVPVMSKECVVIPKLNENTNFPLKDFSTKPVVEGKSDQHIAVNIQANQKKPASELFETEGGDTLQCFLAFFPHDLKNLQSCNYDCLLINDSNYFLYYNVITGLPGKQLSVARGMIEPNMQEDIVTLNKSDLNDWENLRVQILPFKENKQYEPQDVIDYSTKISPLRFYKLHSFTNNDYFDEPAMMINLTEVSIPVINPDDIKKAIAEKDIQLQVKTKVRPKLNLNPDVLEVDLHMHELLDNTSGMTNAEMLQIQLDKFHEVIAANLKHKGQKIVFIHGKGEGVLRNEILKLLKTRYKSFYYQDASFREYGFGATMIVIR